DQQWSANSARDAHGYRDRSRRAIPRIGLLDAATKGRIIGFPNQAARRNGSQVECPFSKGQLHAPNIAGQSPCLEHAATLLILLRVPFIEDHSITRLDDGFE